MHPIIRSSLGFMARFLLTLVTIGMAVYLVMRALWTLRRHLRQADKKHTEKKRQDPNVIEGSYTEVDSTRERDEVERK